MLEAPAPPRRPLAGLPLSRLVPALLVLLVAVVLTVPQRLAHSGLLRKQPPAREGEVEQVVVVAVDVPRGTRLTEDMVKVRDWPKGVVPPGALKNVDDAVGRTCLTRLVPDEPVQDARLTAKGVPGGIAALIPKGMRAYTVQTPSLAAGVAPGQRVDVLLTVGRGEKHPIDFRTFTLLKGVQILAVEGPRRQPDGRLLHWDSLVTLLVSQGQAAQLTGADRVGALHFACPGDGEEFPLAEGHLPLPEWESERPPR
jgi:pilus assembly protein CpaB